MPSFARAVRGGACDTIEPMKIALVLMIVVSAGCASPATPAPKQPAGPPVKSLCPMLICGENGTQLTGLTHGNQAGAIQAITLPSGEIITLQ